MEIQSYMQDGADPQAQATLAYLKMFIGDGIEESWSPGLRAYTATVQAARYHGCRKRGYVVWLASYDGSRQINFVFSEHQVGDSICVHEFEQQTFGTPPTPNTLPEGLSLGKDNEAFKAPVGEAMAAAQFIFDRMTDFWLEAEAGVEQAIDGEGV